MGDPEDYPQRVKGCLLGGMCGDVLGAAVEGWSPERIARSFPKGCSEFVVDTDRGYDTASTPSLHAHQRDMT